jgi:hypothetical protein
MTPVYQSWETSLSHLNRGETPSAALPLSQLTLSEIRLTLGPHVIAYSILNHILLSLVLLLGYFQFTRAFNAFPKQKHKEDH